MSGVRIAVATVIVQLIVLPFLAYSVGLKNGAKAHYKGEIKCETAMGEVICKPVKKEQTKQ